MNHWTPCLGWADHGLFHTQPGFFFDLAAANGYEIALAALSGDGVCYRVRSGGEFWEALNAHPVLARSEMCTVIRKTADRPFSPPVQGMWRYQSPGSKLATMPRRRQPQNRRNLALNRPALQSSTSSWSWHEDPALDAAGANNGHVTGFFSFHTELDDEPWWMVDLGATLPITEVVVHNRLDGELWARRAAHLCLSLSNDAKVWQRVFPDRKTVPLAARTETRFALKFRGRPQVRARLIARARVSSSRRDRSLLDKNVNDLAIAPAEIMVFS